MTMANSTESASRIPVTLRRSSSLRVKGERGYHRTHHSDLFPAITENACIETTTPPPLRRCSSSASLKGPRGNGSGRRRVQEDYSDVDSVRSFGSNCSGMSNNSACDHAHFALNGTTWSARQRRYVVHASPSRCCPSDDSPASEYLTPTQRNARLVRNLQAQLAEARLELEQRDREVARLTKELVELRLRGSEDHPSSPDAVCGKATLVDSGHFEDPKTPSTSTTTTPRGAGGRVEQEEAAATSSYCEQRALVAGARHFEARIDEMQRRHLDETQRLKQAHHDKLEALLNQLAELSSRYCEAQPALEDARARARKLEAELGELRPQLRQCEALLAEQDERNKRAYLEMCAKGQEAAALAAGSEGTDQKAQSDSQKVTVAELLRQLTVTQAELDNVRPDTSYGPTQPSLALALRSQSLLSLQEAISLWVLGTRKAMYRRILESRNKQNVLDPEITLQFLKSAIYYFLTDRENLHGHLNAIESILGFTDSEKLNIDRIYRSAKK